ncbi:hypothetical protein MXB_5577 [Myxobolus squamalis]|nr:hypothetical protein MXB_5577 [Myxobolus squamalis]
MSTLSILFNDFYQLTMSYSYWKNKKYNDMAVFEAYFRRNPFKQEFTIFAGLTRFLQYLNSFHVTDSDIESIKRLLGSNIEEEFYEYIRNLDTRDIEVYAIEEGTIVFPTVPLIQICGPIIGINLVATNAAHFRIAAGDDLILAEFGCRRAQGPDGALSSSLYSYMGGFDSTSNVEAALLFNIPVSGTVSHSYVSSYSRAPVKQGNAFQEKLLQVGLAKLKELENRKIISTSQALESEYEAFAGFASSFPDKYLVIIDTYNVLRSGLPNFCAVALALHQSGHRPIGVRLDSGDLAYLSKMCRLAFHKIAKTYNLPWFSSLTIVASSEITIESIYSMRSQNHEINVFGIGTNLVTCALQPSLGMVYKLVQYKDVPTIKLTEDIQKASIPFKKKSYRLFNKEGFAILDYLSLWDEDIPQPNQQIMCYHPFHVGVKAYVIPSEVQKLDKLVFCQKSSCEYLPDASQIRNKIKINLKKIRCDHLRYTNPTPFKVSLSEKLYNAFHACKNPIPSLEIE